MARYRIVCAQHEACTAEDSCSHISSVGTGLDPDKADKMWDLLAVLVAMDSGDSFYTKGAITGAVAEVETYNCRYCRCTYIRSHKHGVPDNNLDNLHAVNWQTSEVLK